MTVQSFCRTLRKSMVGQLNLLLISKVSQRQRNMQIFGIYNPYLFLLLCTTISSYDNTLFCSKTVARAFYYIENHRDAHSNYAKTHLRTSEQLYSLKSRAQELSNGI